MTGLRPPPSSEARSRVLGRFLVLIVLLAIAGVVVWAAVTNQRIDLIENTRLSDVENSSLRDVDGIRLHVISSGTGRIPMVLLHDLDVAGGVLWGRVAEAIGLRGRVILIDLPGFGFSDRITEAGSRHTVASMAQTVSAVVEPLGDMAVFAGVGLGGEVAAEIGVTNPDLVAGLVLLDVDFYAEDGLRESIERLPWVGRAATFSFEAGGSFAFDRWAPNCETGGWCPSQVESAVRSQAESIIGTTASIQAFRKTPASSLVPAQLGDISAPTIFVWSEEGDVPRESVDEALSMMNDVTLEVRSSWKAHVEEPSAIADLIVSLLP